MHTTRRTLALALLLAPAAALAQTTGTTAPQPTPGCSSCVEWNVPQRPFRIFGNSYYVGTHGLAVILISSDSGHVLIDGALPESAPQIIDNIRALGFRIEDVRLIVSSHDHFDHAGGLAALQKASGAPVAASVSSAAVLRRGTSGLDDPQYGSLPSFAPVATVRDFRDLETQRVGPLALTPHLTPGHTPGGTTWTWQSCESGRCLDLVYADSQTPVSSDGFSFTKSRTYPTALRDFAHGANVLDHLRCDILITPHPGASALWDRLAARDAGNASALIDSTACRRYAANARDQVAKRVASEANKP